VTAGPGFWLEKIYYFRPDGTPSCGGDEVHTEYFVPYKDFIKAINALYEIRDVFKHLVHVSHFRMVCADNIPLSPAKGQAVVGIHWTWKRRHSDILKVLPIIDKTLAQFNAKPHYGELFHLSGKRLHELLGDDLR